MERERVEVSVGQGPLIGDRWAGAGPRIVLLHPGVCDRRCWREVGARLGAAGWDVVAYDRRGYGEVPPPGGRFRHVDDLIAVLDGMWPGVPAWLMGSSMGGQVALDAALETPERVAGLVLLAPAVSGDPELDEAAYDAATGGLAGAIDAAWTAGDLEACNRLEIRLWLDGPAGPEGRVSGPARALALEMNRIVLANDRMLADAESDADGASGLDAARRAHEITAPALVACGDLDVPTKMRRCAELADTLGHATCRTLPGRAHLPYLEAPDEVAALVAAAAA
jgi:pimeloyl-ACP methyl ester carboxylesterase